MTMRRGFSLVELSIVLVILGLLVGGVLGGQSLIKAAQLRSVITEKDKYVTASNTFREKYGTYPGDLANATSYWGAAHATTSTCISTIRTTSATCNGTGNGIISIYSTPDAQAGSEDTLVWEHLSLAGLIEGRYTGWTSNVGHLFRMDCGGTSPQSKLGATTCWNLWHQPDSLSYNASSFWGGRYGHILLIAGYSTRDQGAYAPNLPPFAPEEAYSIDAKIDDGKPGLGSVRTLPYSTALTQCSTGAADNTAYATATYNLAVTNKTCSLAFNLD